MQTLTIGKYRSLQHCSTRRGAISVLALDHRNNLRTALNPEAPDQVADGDLIEFKQQVISRLSPVATATLLDPMFGAAHCVASGALPGQVGLLVAVEESGYTGDPMARHSKLAPGFSVAKVRRMGGSAVKLLVYYHPDSSTAGEIEALVRQVAEDCQAQDLPLFVEPLSYSLDPSKKKLAPEELQRVVLETARRLTQYPMDVLKAEFPLDIAAYPDEKHWSEACTALSSASRVPWVLLSASVDYDVFLRQVTVACQQGASGVAVGRAVWKEATKLTGEGRLNFLNTIAKERMERITALCDALAKPWTDFFTAPELTTDWYVSY